jgi:predicted phage-related endonuclease
MHEVNYIDVEQGTDEWRKLRLGMMSASRAKDLLATVGRGEAAGFRNYVTELATERIVGRSADRYVTKQMQYGTDTEPVARTMYSLITGNVVKKSGIYIIEGKMACASLDGEIGDNGTLEIKNREIANHVESLATGKVPDEYYKQMQFQFWVTNKTWGDYESYCDEMPENAQIFLKRIERDEIMIAQIEERYALAERRIEEITATIKSYKMGLIPAGIGVTKL